MALYGTGSNVNQTTDVSAGNYGSASAIPIITVDSDKRLTHLLVMLVRTLFCNNLVQKTRQQTLVAR